MGKRINFGKLGILFGGIVLIVLFNILFLDNLLKWGLEAGGSAIFGAKTDVAKLDLRLKDFSLNIFRLEIANKNDPWKNIIDIGRIRTAINGNQFAFKRFIMDEVVVEDIALGTTRNYSGEIKKAAAVEVSSNVSKGFDISKMSKSLQIDPAKTLEKVGTVGELESKAELERVQKENDTLMAETDQKVNAFKPEESLKAIDLSALQNIGEANDLASLQEKLKAAEKAVDQFAAIQKEYDSTRSLADGNMKKVQENLAKVSELKNKDLAKIYDKLNIGNYDFKSIGRSMLGPKINGYADTALYWMSMAKQYMPAKKPSAKKTKKQRIKGIDVIFADNSTMPKFLIRKIALSGIATQSSLNAVAYNGQIQNITSEPVRLGKPMTIDIKGRFTNNPNSNLSIAGVLDHTKDVASDKVTFTVSGYKLEGMQLWDEATIPLSIKKGVGTISGALALQDETVDGRITFTGRDMGFSKLSTDNSTLEGMIADALSTAPMLTVEVLISGPIDAPETRVLTNADAIIGDSLQKNVTDKIDAVKKDVEAAYDKQVGAAQKEAQAKVEAQTKVLQEALAKQQAVIDAKNKELQTAKDEIEQKIEDMKNEQVKGVENKLKEALPAGLVK